METGCAMAMARAVVTESAAATTGTQATSAWTASKATSTKPGTTPSLSAQVIAGFCL